IIFGGTTEGRLLAQRAHDAGRDVLVCVTSEYARGLLDAGIPCRVGAMDEMQMLRFLEEQQPERIIDATHPYAVRVSQSIRTCAVQLGVPLERVMRDEAHAAWQEAAEWVDDAQQAAEAAARTQGNVLLTTGSHTLGIYAERIAPERLYARVLPTVASIAACEGAGIPNSHIIAMQGPFSAQLNDALYAQLQIAVMVTKDSGEAGGVSEKVLPALSRGIHVIAIRRPQEESICGENR
ncbi:MAG: precorrin-6A reductase, partial [Candidatus Ventricola sp.]